jgi:MFS family permease
MLILFSLSRSFEFSLVLLVISGFALVTQMAASNTVLQTLVDDDKRGRVMALFSMAFLGVAPLGSLLSGAIATAFGAPVSLAIAGVICLVVAGIFSLQIAKLRPLIRPIYQAKGILPEIAAGIEATENLEGARD